MITAERVRATIRNKRAKEIRPIEMSRNESSTSYCTRAVQIVRHYLIIMSRKRRSSGVSKSYIQISPSGYDSRLSILLSIVSHLSLIRSQEHDATRPPPQEGPQAQFYKEYHKVAEEYDKEFLKKYDEDLNTTLIFVSVGQFLWACTNQGSRQACFLP